MGTLIFYLYYSSLLIFENIKVYQSVLTNYSTLEKVYITSTEFYIL